MTIKETVTDLCRKKGIPRSKMEKDLGLGNGTSGKWDTSVPGAPILKKVADYFEVSIDYLMHGKDDFADESYYINEETSQIAQTIFENKELRLLFDAAEDASPEDLMTVHSMLLALKRKEQKNDD